MMEWASTIEAVFFDMDGTLLDSEPLTERAISQLLLRFGIDDSIDGTQFHGVTWKSIAHTLQDLYPVLADVPVASELAAGFHQALISEAPPAIAGSPNAVMASAMRLKTAVVSSSRRSSIEHVVHRMGLETHVHHIVGAEDVQRSKPDPQCFQLAAERFGVSCQRCLVFEDSMAGLQAARSAGMRTIAIGPSEEKGPLSDMMVSNFRHLPDGFFESLGATCRS
ncbi:MAG: hypothetical protein CL930_10945 [Deltaproteobacteria bacterium]|nr:hypothetical protein [Deltaproteobacteria bacterium]